MAKDRTFSTKTAKADAQKESVRKQTIDGHLKDFLSAASRLLGAAENAKMLRALTVALRQTISTTDLNRDGVRKRLPPEKFIPSFLEDVALLKRAAVHATSRLKEKQGRPRICIEA